VGLEERAGGDCAGATLKLVERRNAIIQELEGLVELVGISWSLSLAMRKVFFV
jgi:hypothetical protein